MLRDYCQPAEGNAGHNEIVISFGSLLCRRQIDRTVQRDITFSFEALLPPGKMCRLWLDLYTIALSRLNRESLLKLKLPYRHQRRHVVKRYTRGTLAQSRVSIHPVRFFQSDRKGVRQVSPQSIQA